MRKWREIFGITQTELADKLSITSSTISDYEGGRRKSPGILVIARFVETLIEIDNDRGGRVVKQLEKDFTRLGSPCKLVIQWRSPFLTLAD